MVWAIETADDYRRVEADDWRAAIRKAWKKNPPTHLGVLTRISGKSWGYIDSEEALKIAGYKIAEEARVSRRRPARRRGRLARWSAV